MHDVTYPLLQYHTESFHCPKNSLCSTRSSLLAPLPEIQGTTHMFTLFSFAFSKIPYKLELFIMQMVSFTWRSAFKIPMILTFLAKGIFLGKDFKSQMLQAFPSTIPFSFREKGRNYKSGKTVALSTYQLLKVFLIDFPLLRSYTVNINKSFSLNRDISKHFKP